MNTLHENCYDCAEFYHTCAGWPASQEFGCGDFRRLPDVGVGGKTGQQVPPSRMGGRTQPRVRRDFTLKETAAAQVRAQRPDRRPGPRPVYGDDGVRRCVCGLAIPERKRCCNACREVRRQASLQRRLNRSTSTP